MNKKSKMLEEFLVHVKADSIKDAERNISDYCVSGASTLPRGMKISIKSLIYDCSGDITRKIYAVGQFKGYLPFSGEIDYLLRNMERDRKVPISQVLPNEAFFVDLKTKGCIDYYFILARERPWDGIYSNFSVTIRKK